MKPFYTRPCFNVKNNSSEVEEEELRKCDLKGHSAPSGYGRKPHSWHIYTVVVEYCMFMANLMVFKTI